MSISNIKLKPQEDFGMKKIGFLILAIILLSIFAILLLPYIWDLKNDFWKNLEKSIANGDNKIYAHTLTDFNWDTVCVLPPYALDSGIDKEARLKEFIKGDLGEFRNRLPLQNQDGWWAFAFIENGKVVAIKEKGRSFYLRDKYKNNCISKDNAFFTVEGNYIFINDNSGG